MLPFTVCCWLYWAITTRLPSKKKFQIILYQSCHFFLFNNLSFEACKRFRVQETGECVENCERIEIANPSTGQMEINPNGMYEYSIACVKSCPSNTFV